MHKQINNYVKTWELRCYFDGIPDEAPEEIKHLVPSYKQIAICILKNDLRPLGIEPKQSLYYDVLKKIELSARGFPIQLTLF